MLSIRPPTYGLLASLIPTLILLTPASARDCASDNRLELICSDPDLLTLENSVAARVDRIAAIADPLTALLLKRDQAWFSATLENAGGRQQIIDMLQRRETTLGRIQTGTVDDLSGEWVNALGAAMIRRQSIDTLLIAIVSKDPSEDYRHAECSLTVEAKLRRDGWFAGQPVAAKLEDDTDLSSKDDKAGKNPAQSEGDAKSVVRLRMQGNTLRIVSQGNHPFCRGPDMTTGTYFLVGARPQRASDLAARTIAPSFNCATAQNLDEMEICADPDLARQDAEIARAYGAALHRVDTKLAAHLRNDQRAWAKDNATVAETWLNPYWDKMWYLFDHTSEMREELNTRQRERLALLINLDNSRHGLEGLWVAHNAIVRIAPVKDKSDLMTANGWKWQTGHHKYHCDFEIQGQIAGDRFMAEVDVGDQPALRRDGATLTIDGDDADPDKDGFVDQEQPGYCTRLRSAKARLLPVKAGTEVGERYRTR